MSGRPRQRGARTDPEPQAPQAPQGRVKPYRVNSQAPASEVEDGSSEPRHLAGSTGNGSPQKASLPQVPIVAGVPLAEPHVRTPEETVRRFRARRRSLLSAGLALLVILLIVETLILSPWTDPVAGQPPRQESAIPLSDVNPYGVNVFLHKEVDSWKKEKTLDMAVDMGAGWIKQQFPWAEIEFSKGNYYDTKNNQSAWAKFDTIVDLAQQRGLRIIARLDSTPEWARTDDSMSPAVRDALSGNAKVPPAPGHVIDFADFVSTFVSRYHGRVAAIQIWNEPNLHDEWPTGVDAKSYVNLLSAGYLAAKHADPNVIVLAAPLATNKETLAFNGNLNELDYLQAMYYAGARPFFDVMSANAYGKDSPPEDPPSRDKLNFRRVELLRKVMERNDDSNKAIWFNEYGWNASPASMSPQDLPWGRVTPEQQADYTVRGIEYARQYWPWAGVFTIWYLRQVGDIPQTKSEYYFSMVNPEFVPQPVYSAVQQAANSQGTVATPGDWGPLSSPIQAGAAWSIGLSSAAPGGLYVAPTSTTLKDQDGIHFTFEGTDLSLNLIPQATVEPVSGTETLPGTQGAAAATAAPRARYYVTVDGSSNNVAHTLPRDSSGRAYIDLPGSGQATQVTVVQGLGTELPTGKHTLDISVLPLDTQGSGEAGHVAAPLPQPQTVNLPGISGVRVDSNRSYLFFVLMTLAILVGIGLAAWALWRSRTPQTTRVGGAVGR